MAIHQTLLFDDVVAVKVVVVIVELTKYVIPAALGQINTADGMTPSPCVIVVPPVWTKPNPNAMRLIFPVRKCIAPSSRYIPLLGLV